MKYQITQTITQSISRIVEADDREHALSMIKDADFIQSIEEQRMEQFEKDEEEWEVKLVRDNPSERIYHARRCDVTGEGMDEGWLCGDDYYIKYETDLISYLKGVYNQDYGNYQKDKMDGIIDKGKLRELLYEDGYFLYTEWYEEDDIMYVEVDGKVRLMTDADYKIKQFDELNK